MVLLILACLFFLALFPLALLHPPKQSLLLTGCLCILVLLNFLHELTSYQGHPSLAALNQELLQDTLVLLPEQSERGRTENEQWLWGELLEEEKGFARLLIRGWQQREHSLLHFEGLPGSRLLLLLDLLRIRANCT